VTMIIHLFDKVIIVVTWVLTAVLYSDDVIVWRWWYG